MPVGIEHGRAALGGGLPFLLFRLQDGFTVPPWLRFPWPPKGPSHNAYILESVTIHYRWSALWGASLPVLRRIHREGGDCVVCESPSGGAIAIPIWDDGAVCMCGPFGRTARSLAVCSARVTHLSRWLAS